MSPAFQLRTSMPAVARPCACVNVQSAILAKHGKAAKPLEAAMLSAWTGCAADFAEAKFAAADSGVAVCKLHMHMEQTMMSTISNGESIVMGTL